MAEVAFCGVICAALRQNSAKIPARRHQGAEQFAVIEQALGDQMHHGILALAFALQSSGDAEQPAVGQDSARTNGSLC